MTPKGWEIADTSVEDGKMTTQFQLDTSGYVVDIIGCNGRQRGHLCEWLDLTLFEQGCVEALLRSFFDSPMGQEMALGGRFVGFSGLAPETLQRIRDDCARFTKCDPFGADVGRHFYRVRQTGAWSDFPPLTIRLGDDGKVYLR
jgi:hypothetical protein